MSNEGKALEKKGGKLCTPYYLMYALKFFKIFTSEEMCSLMIDLVNGLNRRGGNLDLKDLSEIKAKHSFTQEEYVPKYYKPSNRNYYYYKRKSSI